MIFSDNSTTISRDYLPEFIETVWMREWHLESTTGLKEELETNRACSGFGVDDPIAIKVGPSSLTTFTAANGVTLAEKMMRRDPFDEGYIRDIVEQLCYGLHRLHLGQNLVHGAVRPLNIRVGTDGRATLWSIPSARLEPEREAPYLEWYQTYRPGRSLRSTPAGDIYFLGAVMHSALKGKRISESTATIIERCMSSEPKHRFSTVAELAMALDNKTQVPQIDIPSADVEKLRAAEAYQKGLTPQALEHWQAALRYDWLDITTRNNIAVVRASQAKWLEAIHELHGAYRIFGFHPMLDTNIGMCQLRLGDTEAAEFWLRRAITMNPYFFQPHTVFSELHLKESRVSEALSHAREAVTLAPTLREARLQLARALRANGNILESESQQNYAKILPLLPALSTHLCKPGDPPPWGPIRPDNPPDDEPELGSGVPLRPIGPHLVGRAQPLIRAPRPEQG